jgi:hypothetical protein
LNGQSATHALCDYAASNLDGTGVVRQYRPTKIGDIADGTSNTCLVGDKRLNLNRLGEPQADDNEGYTCGWNEDTVRVTSQRPLAQLLPCAPRVSVVVCSYNGGRTLEQCLRSLRGLHYPDYEVIVVDDGSTDQTPDILKRFPEVRSAKQTAA